MAGLGAAWNGKAHFGGVNQSCHGNNTFAAVARYRKRNFGRCFEITKRKPQPALPWPRPSSRARGPRRPFFVRLRITAPKNKGGRDRHCLLGAAPEETSSRR